MERHKYSKLVGYRLSLLRNEKGLTQAKLSEISGLDPTYIGAIERGEKCPSIYNLYRLVTALDVEMTVFFENL
ncbi:helix-turn-helix domain-containing protein [Paenibacillus sp. y28]|uniref:helix-turn-helix domain-containing protein n=1 Tax=Paenibacillus sp. y28 TaxID=3129110 RepID=UPI00301925EA